MKKIVWIVLFYVALAPLALAQPAELNGKIKFVWGDEFNGPEINADIWDVRDRFDNYGDGDGGVALKKNVWISGNGLLNFQVVKETYYCTDGPDGNYIHEDFCYRQKEKGIPYNFTYGRVDSKRKYNQQYGYAEASMHFRPQPGLWPAFWTIVGDGHYHTNAGEFDIMERVSDPYNNTVTTNVHLAYCDPGTGTDCPNGVGSYCSNAPQCYGVKHILTAPVSFPTKYALYWTPTEMVFYINDVRVRRDINPGIVDPLKFILGMGVSTKDVQESNEYPSFLYVDYIHVYDLQECLKDSIVGIGKTVVNNMGTPNILVGCTKVDGNGTTGGKMTLVATNSVAMLPNFSVKEGGYLVARISNVGKVENTTDELPTKYYPLHMQGQSNTNPIVSSEKVATEELFTVSPNPIVNTASINYAIAKQAGVKITLYNIMGIVQDELVNEHQLAGEHTYELDATNYKAGVYLLVFESGESTQKRTVVITK